MELKFSSSLAVFLFVCQFCLMMSCRDFELYLVRMNIIPIRLFGPRTTSRLFTSRQDIDQCQILHLLQAKCYLATAYCCWSPSAELQSLVF